MAARPKKKGRIAQSQRFKDTAKRLGADESGEAFERALKKIVPPKKIRPRS
jgi:hypothetical protein